MAGLENPNANSSAAAAVAPWTQIVRSDAAVAGEENYSAAVVVEGESADDNAAAGGSKMPAVAAVAWSKKPASEVEAEGGGATGAAAGGVVMGAELWPALSESTGKASPKVSPSNSAMNLPDLGSNPSQKSTISPVNLSSIHNQRPVCQKPIKREVGAGGGVNAQVNGVFLHNQPPHNDNNFVKNGSSGGSGGSESSGRDNNAPNQGYRESSGGMRNPGGDHPNPRGSSFRRGNGGPHSRGDGSHQNYGGRRGDQDWNQQRNFNGRDAAPLQPRVSPRGYGRPALGSAPFHPGGHPPMWPFPNPMPMHDVHMIYAPPAFPFIGHMHPSMHYPVDPQLPAKIVRQIDYYFSNENLVKDTFLRQNMDKDGWVSVSLIASFKKVRQLTESIPLIPTNTRCRAPEFYCS